MANANTTTYSDTVKTMYERRLLVRALPRLIHHKGAMNATWKGFGSYEYRKFSSLSAVTSTLTEGTTPDEGSAPSLTTYTITPSWYGSWIKYTDKLNVTEFDPVISEISGILGEQAGLSFDTLIRNEITANASKAYAGAATQRTELDTVNDLIDYESFAEQVAYMMNANARPVNGDRYIVIIHPFTWSTLMQDTTFVAMFTREGGNSIRTGYMGEILGCDVYVSSNVRSYVDGGASSADPYSALFIGQEAFVVAGFTGLIPKMVDNGPEMKKGGRTGEQTKPVEIIVKGLGETGLDPLNQRGTVGWKGTLATEVLNSAWIRDLEHCNGMS